MSLPVIKSRGPTSPSDYNVEFRSVADDAWYTVRTVLDGEKLSVKYHNFSDDHDSVFLPQNFKSLQDIMDFEKLFRPISVQLQDRECENVSVGTVVCASHSLTGFDVRFYDAVIDDVHHRDHSITDGEEQCMCTFIVTWIHGPTVGLMGTKKIENICLVDSNIWLDPNVATFSRLAREKLEGAVHRPSLLPISGTFQEETAFLPSVKPGPTFNRCFTQEKLIASLSLSNIYTSKEIQRMCNHAQRIKEDIDFGGVMNNHVVLIDNLEKELTPSSIVEFIHTQTSISVQAYVFPSLPSETYTNGAVVLDCDKSFRELSEFLDSPNHIIISRRGRPWVITERLSKNDTYAVPLENLVPKYQNKECKNGGIGKDLKLAQSGSEEFKTAKCMRDLFIEFSEHQRVLHKKLALEEQRILHPSL